MSRRNSADYAGPRSSITLGQAAKLSPSKWVLQPKIDGCYGQVVLDGRGHVAEVLSRTGRPYSADVHGLSDAGQVGAPWSILVGELTAHTEAGRREVQALGYTRVHLYDAVQIGRDRVVHRSYRYRRDALRRMHAALGAEQGDGLTWDDDARGCAHDRSTGRYTRRRAVGWRRAPVVPQAPVLRLDERWADVERLDLEGLVAVNLDAPIGRRGAKRKIKKAATHDAVVVRVEGRRVGCLWAGRYRLTMGSGGSRIPRPPRVGDTVEFLCSGYYDSGEPRHPRIVRVREDLR